MPTICDFYKGGVGIARQELISLIVGDHWLQYKHRGSEKPRHHPPRSNRINYHDFDSEGTLAG